MCKYIHLFISKMLSDIIISGQVLEKGVDSQIIHLRQCFFFVTVIDFS